MRGAAAGLLAICCLAVLAGQLVGGPAGPWLLALGSAGAIPALMLLGVGGRRGSSHRRGAVAVIVALGVVLVASTAGLVAVSGHPGVWLGLSPGLLVLLAGVWLVPLVLVGVGFGLTYEDRTDSGSGAEPPGGEH
jgi:hypothetical protein